jgi:hypothetical protein
METAITVGHLKEACSAANWDLLDYLLELDNAQVNYNSMYTDTWGEWWAMLLDVVYRGEVDGVRILLKHGADPALESWGDCLPRSAREVVTERKMSAPDNPSWKRMDDLFSGREKAAWSRSCDPKIPPLGEAGRHSNDRQNLADDTGLQFQ